MTPAQKHMAGVASLGCVTCIGLGYMDTPAQVHHCGTYMGGGRDDWKTVPLCPEHHTGKNGIHKAGKNRRTLEGVYLKYVAEHCPCVVCAKARGQ